jgi:drug/metabolite transporter (DMT)-like permease
VRISTPRLFAAAVAIWGTTWIAITFQLGRAPPEASVALRFAIASALLLAGCRARGRRLRFPLRVHAELALLGLFMFCVSYLAVYRAETLLVSGLVAVGYSASPLVNAAISRVAFGTPATPGGVGGGLLGVAGIVLVFWPELARVQADAGVLAGAGLVVLAVLASGVGNVFASRLERHGLGVWQKMAWGMAWGALGSALAALAGGDRIHFSLTLAYVASLLYLAVFGSIAAFAAYLTLLERVGAARAG